MCFGLLLRRDSRSCRLAHFNRDHALSQWYHSSSCSQIWLDAIDAGIRKADSRVPVTALGKSVRKSSTQATASADHSDLGDAETSPGGSGAAATPASSGSLSARSSGRKSGSADPDVPTPGSRVAVQAARDLLSSKGDRHFGCMHKTDRKGRRWTRRFFCLHGSVLSYYTGSYAT